MDVKEMMEKWEVVKLGMVREEKEELVEFKKVRAMGRIREQQDERGGGSVGSAEREENEY
jgi:hypothetical protein